MLIFTIVKGCVVHIGILQILRFTSTPHF